MNSLKRVARLLRGESRSYAIVCICGLVVACLEMIPPRLVGKTVNQIASEHFSMRPVLGMAALWAVVALIVQNLHVQQIRLANRAGERLLAGLRATIFAHIQKLSMSFFDQNPRGRVLSLLTNNLESLRNVLIWGLNTLFANLMLMVLAATMMALTDWRLFLGTVWLFPAMTFLNFLYGNKITEAWHYVYGHSMRVAGNQAENIAGARVVTAFNRQVTNLAEYNELQRINTMNNVSASRKSGLFQPVLQWNRFAGQAIILLFGGYRVATGNLSTGDLVSMSLYWEWFMQPAVNFGVFINDLLVALSGASQIFTFLDERPRVCDKPRAASLPPLKGRVCFEDVSFSYRPESPVLKNVSFDIRAGATVALVGPTGCGKTTVLSLLARFYEPLQGRIAVDGYDISDHTSASLHQQMAIVLQHNHLFRGTIMENLRYPRPNASADEVKMAARALGCHERFASLSDGYDTNVGEGGSGLSLGERQLVCFTRALLASPKILLLDEATSAIDPVSAMVVQQALASLCRGRTTFVVAHRLSTVVHADLILMLDQGRVIEQGTHGELLRRHGRYCQLYSQYNSFVAHQGTGLA